MKSCLVLFLALGLASATETTIKKLTVFGVPGVSTLDAAGSSIFGVKSIYPYNFPVQASPFIPYNFYTPYTPSILRSDIHSTPISLRDVYHKPVIVIVKSKPGVEGLTAYILEHGLSSLADYPNTRFIHDTIKTGSEKTAVVVNPATLYNTPAFRILKDIPITKFEVPAGIKFAKFVGIVDSNVPYVFIHDKDDANTFELEGLIRVGSFDVAEEKITCTSCY